MGSVIDALRQPGFGFGSGDGFGYGDGSGFGYGFGYGYGDGYGDGSGSGDGDGFGDGDGYGDGSGFGDGDGFGDGGGYGDGSGSGYGDGYGDGGGSGIGQINGLTVYEIDDVQTVIYRERGNVAKGAILRSDLTLEPCYVVTQDGRFAHGNTLRDAMGALRNKLFEDMPEEERIAAFVEAHEWGKEYPDNDFFEWHNRLTGSCEMGRMEFVRERGLEKLDGKRTVEDFIRLCKDSYGGEIIRKLPEAYGVALAYFGG